MTVLEHLAQAAAVILLLELLVGVLIFLAISGGLAFGLHWVRTKTSPAFTKVNQYTETGTGYVHRGTDYLALPVILAGRYASFTTGAVHSIQRRVRRVQAARTGVEEANEAGKPEPVAQEPDILV